MTLRNAFADLATEDTLTAIRTEAAQRGTEANPTHVVADTGLSQPLTDAQLRAAAVPVSGTVTVANPTAQGLTDAELRATPIATSLASMGTPADAVADSDSGTFSLIGLFKRLLGKFPDLINGGLRLAGYDSGDDMIKVKSVQKKFRDSFVGASLNAAKWDSAIGTGGTVTTGSGVLTMGSGTTANAQTSIITKETFTIPFRVNIGLTLSQRIANQTFIVEAVSVDPVTGVPDGLHSIGLRWDGTTATQGKYAVQNSGTTELVSAAVTLPTTASGGFYEIEPFADEAWFHGGTLDSSGGRANSYRRHQQIPEPNAVFKIRLRWLNGASAPASNTNAVVQYISVQDYAELTAEITAGRGQTVAGQAIGVAVVSGTVTANHGTWTTPATNILNSAATTNGTVVKASAGTIYGGRVFNNGAAAAYLKLHNSTTVTVGTTAVAMCIKIPAGEGLSFDFGTLGARYATGICYSITGGVADTDTAAVAAGQVKVNLSYI